MAEEVKITSDPEVKDNASRKPGTNLRMTSLLSPFSKKQPKEEKEKKEKPPKEKKEKPPKEKKEKPPKQVKEKAVKEAKEKQPKEHKEKRVKEPGPKKSDKRALASALTLRSLTFGVIKQGSESATSPRPALKQIKSDLLNPEIANRLITQLHALPAPSGPSATVKEPTEPVLAPKHGDSATSVVYPIHAVSLDCTDEEAENTIFLKLPSEPQTDDKQVTRNIRSVAFADVGVLLSTFKDLNAVNLLQAPDFGLGQPIEGEGLLAGSVPDPSTVSDGLNQIAQQLMALGFATTNAVYPNHTGVYPPLDRMSLITYWWGMELVLPEPSVKHLNSATSVSHAVLNFLSAVALINNGVREVLPFVRYISQFVDFEWSTIKAQDQGQGVVCASTWVMPAAMVPRPWDFAPPPPTAQTTTTAEVAK